MMPKRKKVPGRGSLFDPIPRKRALYNKLYHDVNAEMRNKHQAKRFLEGMETFESKGKLLAQLTDSRKPGMRRIQEILSFIADARDVEELLHPLLRHAINDETCKPLYRSLRDKFLHGIFLVPCLVDFLAHNNIAAELSKDSARMICSFFLYIAKAVGEARASEAVGEIAKNLRERGDVEDAQTLCTVLMVDVKSRMAERATNRVDVTDSAAEVACWVTDTVPPGSGRHDNDHLNYRDVTIVPTSEELRCKVPPYLPLASGENRFIDDPNQCILDSNFRLLREDAVNSMRENIAERKFPWANARVVGLDLKGDASYGTVSFIVQCDPRRGSMPDWKRALNQGSILAFLDENSNLVRNGIITISRDDKGAWLNDEDGPKIGVIFSSDTAFEPAVNEMIVNRAVNSNYTKRLREGSQKEIQRALKQMKTYEMIEVSKSFFAYQPVLKALQSMESIPFSNELVGLKPTSEGPPAYLPKTVSFPKDDDFHGYECSLENLSENDMANNTSLDLSQARAVSHALTSRVSLIQGPPGTGKTFIGGLLAQLIRKNSDETILCICYTNHALDQFLEHMINFGESRIVRLGSRSKSEQLAKYQLRELSRAKSRRDDGTSTRIKQVDAQMHRRREAIAEGVALLEQPIGWESPHGGIREVLEREYRDEYDHLHIPTSDADGFYLIGKDGKELKEDFLWKKWKEGSDFPPFMHAHKDMSGESNVFWSLSLDRRLDFVSEVERRVIESISPEIESVNELNDLARERATLCQENDLKILRGARVVGATTSGAARYRDLLSTLSPGVVIVEEAGEVLEAHVLSSLTAKTRDSDETKHLILIGDHKQLRPKVESYNLTSASGGGYNLDVSLFERLILGGLPSAILEVQHRMRPSISRFIRTQTYKTLVDHESVYSYPEVKGVHGDVLFLDHRQPEDGSNTDHLDTMRASTTKSNQYEVDVAVEIVRFFLLQGYQSDRIVVLTPYLGQLFKIIKAMKSRLHDVQAYISEQDLENFEGDELTDLASSSNSQNNSVRCSSIDNYQGEENDIVVISLVRSNRNGVIGFLKEEQRVNVLLSRARLGMYLIGNSATLVQTAAGEKTWGPILTMLRESGQVRSGLPTVCQLHLEDEPIELSSPEDFRRIRPNGGCNRKCTFRLACGHACPQMCHPVDQSHVYAQKVCCEPCKRIPPECHNNHTCQKLCKEECGACRVPVGPLTLNCGHTSTSIVCHDTRSSEALENVSSRCRENVTWEFAGCGHRELTTCSNTRSVKPSCPALCGALAECGHPCKNRCGDCDGEHNCKQACERSHFCGHICGRACHLPRACPPCKRPCAAQCGHSKCPKRCREPCASCVEPCDWDCKHQGKCDLVCGAPCSRLPCNKRCEKKLDCGHQCPSVCGEDCPIQVYCVECGNKKFRSTVVDMILFATYAEHDLDADPIVLLPCRHFFSISTLDGHIGMESAYQRDSSDGSFVNTLPLKSDVSEKAKQCPECRAIIHSVRRYGRMSKFAALRSLERKHLMSVEQALSAFAKKETNTIESLRKLEAKIRSSPMQHVYEACAASEQVQVPVPPTRPLLHCLQLLGEAYANQVKQCKDDSFEKAIESYEEAVAVSVATASKVSGGSIRLSYIRFMIPWKDDPRVDLKERISDHLNWIIENLKGVSDEHVSKANSIKQNLDKADGFREVVEAMGAVDGYDYGGVASDHWYECPNGHPYFIGECGGAMQTSRCIECGEMVGGGGHQLTSNNRRATGAVAEVLRGS